MKKDIHPEYREVVFQDVSAGVQFLTRSTVKTRDTIEVDGKEYPLLSISISSASHPFFTGKQKFVDTAGRIEKFQKRFQISEDGGTAGSLRKDAKSKKKAKREARIAAARARDDARSLRAAAGKATSKPEDEGSEKSEKAAKADAPADADSTTTPNA